MLLKPIYHKIDINSLVMAVVYRNHLVIASEEIVDR